MSPRRNRGEEAFTLLELLIAMAVISVLASISITSFIKNREDAVYATLVSDTRNAGMEMEKAAVFKGGSYSTILPNTFFTSNGNTIQLEVVQSSATFFCLRGSNIDYKDMFVYYNSMRGGIVDTADNCNGLHEAGKDTSGNNGNETPSEPPTNPGGSTDPSAAPPATPPASGGGSLVSDGNYTLPASMPPTGQCKTLITEVVDSYTELYASFEYKNLVSYMARLQKDHKEIEDLISKTPEGKRAMAANVALNLNSDCAYYVAHKDLQTNEFNNDYFDLTKAYRAFLEGLNEDSANQMAYVNAYKKLYYRVYSL